MRKFLTTLVAAASLAVAVVATSGPAEAYWRGGWGGWHGGGWGGWHGGGWGWGWGGFAAGAVVGAAIASPYYYPYGYGYYPYYGGYPYGYGYPYYGRPCVWRRVWNGYAWVRACV